MNKRPLGKTCLDVSEIGLGTRAFSKDVEPDEARRILHRALDLGCTFFDTDESYGDAETLIGEVVGTRGIVATSIVAGDLQGIERSLKRLRREAIDVLLLDPQAVGDDDVWASLRALKTAGKVRVIGASVCDPSEGFAAIERGAEVLEVTYHILKQSVSRGTLMDAAWRAGIGVIAREPLANGLLTGKYGKDSTWPASDFRATWPCSYLEAVADKTRKLVFLKRNGRSMAQGAIQFVLANEFVSVTIPGARTVAQVEENFRAPEQTPLNEHELETIFDVTAGCEA